MLPRLISRRHSLAKMWSVSSFFAWINVVRRASHFFYITSERALRYWRGPTLFLSQLLNNDEYQEIPSALTGDDENLGLVESASTFLIFCKRVGGRPSAPAECDSCWPHANVLENLRAPTFHLMCIYAQPCTQGCSLAHRSLGLFLLPLAHTQAVAVLSK